MTPNSGVAGFHTGNPHDLLNNYLAIYDSYHNHKEVMAYTVTAVFVGGAAALFVGSPFWNRYAPLEFALLFCFIAALALMAFFFVDRQLRLRRSAGEMYKACARLAATWLVTAPSEADLKDVDVTDIDNVLFEKFLLPHGLAEQLKVARQSRQNWWWANTLTYTAMLTSAAFVLLRLYLTWQGPAGSGGAFSGFE